MKAIDIVKQYGMGPHEENGSFKEDHFEFEGPGRASSGAMYYYLGKDELNTFHVIDCDEYWIYNAGTPLEMWLFFEDGHKEIKYLGIEENCMPMVYLKKGVVFGAKHFKDADDGTLLTCITVPRFTYEGSILFTKTEMLSKFEDSKEFWE